MLKEASLGYGYDQVPNLLKHSYKQGRNGSQSQPLEFTNSYSVTFKDIFWDVTNVAKMTGLEIYFNFNLQSYLLSPITGTIKRLTPLTDIEQELAINLAPFQVDLDEVFSQDTSVIKKIKPEDVEDTKKSVLGKLKSLLGNVKRKREEG